jgi:dTDP-4-amino-4,6-dideoxygalactose transaminase
MVDLQGQYLKIKDEIDEGIREVIESTAFINGPAVRRFQDNLATYLGASHVIGCGNGTDALQLAMMALDLKPGDEVITTTFTFVATVEVIALLKLTPVLVDVDPLTFNIDPEAVRKAITPQTKAIVPVHLFGQSSPMDEIMDIARAHELFVIEDACQSIGASYTWPDGRTQKTGTIGHLGCTSFFPSKNLGCYGDGGAVFTNDDDLADKVRQMANHGMKVRYYHDSIGVNSRLDTIQAAVLDTKLRYLDDYGKARREAANRYDALLGDVHGIGIPVRYDRSDHVFHQYTLLLDPGIDRDALNAYLSENGVPTGIYYPVPMHLQKAYTDPRYSEGDFPVSESISHRVLSLPMHTELDAEQQEFICGLITGFINQQT